MQYLKKIINFPEYTLHFSPFTFECLVAAITTVLFNQQAIKLIYLQDTNPSIESTLFNVSALFLIFALILLSTIPFLLLNLPRFGAYLFLNIAASATYFSSTYGIIIDETITRSVFETSYGEATQYLNINLVLWNLVFVFSFGLILSFVKVTSANISSRLLLSLKIFGISLGIVFIISLFFYKDYASFLRNNRQIRHMINPISPIYEIGRYWKVKLFPQTHKFTPIGRQAKKNSRSSKRKTLTILILGETARSDHFSLNGYKKNITNPHLSKQDVVTLLNVLSCGTATAISVPCIFSDLGRDKFDSGNYEFRGNLLDVVEHAGYDVKWVDNNTGCQGICSRVENIDISKYRTSQLCESATCYDEVLVKAVQDLTKSEKDQFLVLHMLGSHGPSYYLRYPKNFDVFKPSCDTSEISKCSQEEITNTYDNTILYTDYVLSKLIDYLRSAETRFDSSLIYVSDHGESLGENGIYLHSLPYVLAPREQKTVPMIFWFSENLRKQKRISKFLQTKVNSCQFSHDNIFSTTLSILNISSPEYRAELDLLSVDSQFCRPKHK